MDDGRVAVGIFYRSAVVRRSGNRRLNGSVPKNHQGVFVTVDERKTKRRLALPVTSKKAHEVTEAINALLKPVKKFVQTITFDNGKDEKIALSITCQTYFAKPYYCWERGLNENANCLLRQYFPKTMELISVTTKQLFDAVHKLNSRPRKCLGFKTPYDVFEQLTGITEKRLTGYALMI